MTEVYVDASQVGGNGTDATSAFPSVLSVAFTDATRVWVRNTHNETITSSQFLGPNTVAAGFSKWAFVIGWPQSGMPFYDERPASGISAGWDADVPATQAYSSYGQKMPAFCNSNNSNQGFLGGRNCTLSNMYLVNCGGANSWPLTSVGKQEEVVLDGVFFTFKGIAMTNLGTPPGSGFLLKRATFAYSANNAQPFFTGQFKADYIEIHSSGIGAAILSAGQNQYIKHLQTWANSVISLVQAASNDEPKLLAQGYCKRVAGTRPTVSDIQSVNNANAQLYLIDDYFGFGPRILGHQYNYAIRCTSPSEASYNGFQAMKYSVASWSTSNMYYRGHGDHASAVRAFFDVTSGTPITVKVPVYCDSTGVFSLTNGTYYGHLMAAGCGPKPAVRSLIVAGSLTQWTGSLIAAGSAYEMQFTWTPIETNSQLPFEATFGWPTQATSGAGLIGYMLMGQPHT